ncbi:MAG: phytanoyl-CoA dioxygenase family protein [Chloroflexi bacterium]|nr:phytanoyl-CoA dioxygenase family protein [Chloroflexota bacterium]
MAQVQELGTAAELKFDQYEGDPYKEQLYRFDNSATGIASIDEFSDEHVAFYRETGFLVIQGVFTDREVESALAGFTDLVIGKHADFVGVQFEAASKKYVRTLPPERQLDCVRKLQHFVEFEPRMKAMAWHRNLQRVVSRLLEAEPELFADQALSKPPGIGREKPWHQDHAFFNLPMGTPIVGTWTALDAATLENGCMHVKPGTHKEGPVVHFRRRDWQICDEHLDLNRDVAVPLPPGGVLFFDGLMHHGTPANRSESRRRALQFHFIPAGTEKTEQEERMAVFGSEGKDVNC